MPDHVACLVGMRVQLCAYLKHHAAQLKRYTYGKHILVRLEKISGEKML
jgi:hypothetical protein